MMFKTIVRSGKIIMVATAIACGVMLFMIIYPKIQGMFVTEKIVYKYINNELTSPQSIVKAVEIIDKELVKTSLNEIGQLVGMEGEYNNSFTYRDSYFKSNNFFANILGERAYMMDVNAFFKMGLNLSEINPSDIYVVDDKNLVIALPKTIMISLEMPYDQMEVKDRAGMLRMYLNEESKQLIYGKVKELVRDNIMNDEGILEKADAGNKKALENLLSKIPHVESIKFITKK